jgi:acetyl esterase/lipase
MPRVSLARRVALSALTRPPRHRYGPDRSQVADLHVPRGDGPFPVAVVLHGGYWQRQWGRLTTRPLAADLARRGIAAWNLEYRRLGEGRGGGGGWPMTFDDVAAGVDHLAALGDPRLDLDRVDAVGHSAGGQLALWAAARAGLPGHAPGAGPALAVRRVAALAPVTNLAAAGRIARDLLGTDRLRNAPERLAIADPLRRVPPPVPVLVVHSADDETIPVERSHEYAERVREHGGAVTLVVPEAGGHRAPIDPGSDAWRAAAEWLAAPTSAAATAAGP